MDDDSSARGQWCWWSGSDRASTTKRWRRDEWTYVREGGRKGTVGWAAVDRSEGQSSIVRRNASIGKRTCRYSGWVGIGAQPLGKGADG